MSCEAICTHVPGGYVHSYSCPLHPDHIRRQREHTEALRKSAGRDDEIVELLKAILVELRCPKP
jgi:hypothetical protein